MSDCDDNTVEEFKEVPGHPEYRASRDGRLQSSWSRNGKMTNPVRWRDMTLSFHRDGYFKVELRKNGKSRYKFVHHIIIETFIGERPFPNSKCRHLDGNKNNNHVSNLKWGTPKENSQDMVVHGHSQRGTKHYHHKLTPEDVLEIRRLRSLGLTGTSIADMFDVTSGAIYSIFYGSSWAWLK